MAEAVSGSNGAADRKDRPGDLARAALSASGGPVRISILGATGSIGKSTLDLVGHHPEKFDVVALTA